MNTVQMQSLRDVLVSRQNHQLLHQVSVVLLMIAGQDRSDLELQKVLVLHYYVILLNHTVGLSLDSAHEPIPLISNPFGDFPMPPSHYEQKTAMDQDSCNLSSFSSDEG